MDLTPHFVLARVPENICAKGQSVPGQLKNTILTPLRL